MGDILSFFGQGWVGSLIGVIGVVIGIGGFFSYRISKSVARPCFQKSSLRLISKEENNLPKDVAIIFRGIEVDRLTKTTLIIWNNGTEVLHGNDIVEACPLQIFFEVGVNILSFNILKETNEFNKFRLLSNDNFSNKLIIDFDYLNPKDGVVVELLHNSKERYPKISGAIKGLPKGFSDLGLVGIKGKMPEKSHITKSVFDYIKIKPKFILGATCFFGIFTVVTGLVFPNAVTYVNNSVDNRIFLIVLGTLYTLFPAAILWTRREKYPRELSINEVDSE